MGMWLGLVCPRVVWADCDSLLPPHRRLGLPAHQYLEREHPNDVSAAGERCQH